MEFDLLFAIQNLHTDWLTPIMIFVTTLGNGGIFWIGLGLFLLCFKKSRKCGFLMLLTMALCYLIGNIGIKNLVARPRPFQYPDVPIQLLIAPPDEYSFPSGHTMHSFAAATMLFLHNKRYGIAAFVLAALIAFSRMYLFVHFPTDILGGLLIGIGAAVLVYIVSDKVDRTK